MTPQTTRRLAAAASALALVLAACGSDDGEAGESTSTGASGGSPSAPPDGADDDGDDGAFACPAGAAPEFSGELTVYSGRSEELVAPLIDCFEDTSGIDVEVRYAGSDEMALQIGEEGGDTDADVFFSQTPGALGYLDGEGLLADLPTDLLAMVGEEYHSPTGAWVGTSGRVRTFVYNTDAVAEADLPASIDGVLDPAWDGRLGIAPSNASFQDFVAAMVLERGEDATAEFLAGLADVDPRIEPNNVSIVDAVARGEIDAGLVNHYYGVQALREDPDLPIANHFFPSGDLGSFVLVAGAGIIAGSEHAEQAEAFVAFLLSPVAQRYFSDETGEYPIAGEVPPPDDLPDLASVGIPGYDEGRLGEAITTAARLIEDSGLPT